jgi:hypothetical protein
MEASAQKPWSEQVPACEAPENRPLEPSSDPCGEQGRAAGELRGEARLDHLVQRASREASSRQVIIDGAKTERERLGLLQPALEPSNLKPQISKPVRLPGVMHRLRQIILVLMMFLLCSHQRVSQMHALVAVNFVEKNVA